MLELWRPPNDAGEPVGCLSTTYTFTPALFDEQCLARFMEIESEPDREDLAFTLERESRLGGMYAGVMVDYRQAGVEHSLRWDVLPVRIHAGKQHAKLSLLAWSHHVRLIVASANLSEAGYRTNFEVAGALDFSPDQSDNALIDEAVDFLRELLNFVPGREEGLPEVERATKFLQSVANLTSGWGQPRQTRIVRQRLAFTLPRTSREPNGYSSLAMAVECCRRRGLSPRELWVASPFFDQDESSSQVMAEACKLMARGTRRNAYLYVPRDGGGEEDDHVPRLAAPRCLWTTPLDYNTSTEVWSLPTKDNDKNLRPWHAKMLGLRGDGYSALMIGSSNFTCAGMGIGHARNAEANIVTVVDRVPHAREIGAIEDAWPKGKLIENPEEAEWLGAKSEEDQDDASGVAVPAGFLSATYRAGKQRQITILLEPAKLPDAWVILACSTPPREILTNEGWLAKGGKRLCEIPWEPPTPPAKLLVKWEDKEAFIPINVEDGNALPPPAELGSMTLEQMLVILAASDPSAAFRAWARTQGKSDLFDDDLDSAVPPDLDPLRAYDLQTTFLHRVRRRARVLAQLRANLEHPVASLSALEWRLRGLIGIEALALKVANDVATRPSVDEALLTLADLLVVVSEVQYQPVSGSLPRTTFDRVFKQFLGDLSQDLERRVSSRLSDVSTEALGFWHRVLTRCKT